MARRKKNTGVVFIYPGVCMAGDLPEDRAWTIFHRDVDVGLEHTSTDAHCWCNPVCIPSALIEDGYTHEEWNQIVTTSKH